MNDMGRLIVILLFVLPAFPSAADVTFKNQPAGPKRMHYVDFTEETPFDEIDVFNINAAPRADGQLGEADSSALNRAGVRSFEQGGLMSSDQRDAFIKGRGQQRFSDFVMAQRPSALGADAFLRGGSSIVNPYVVMDQLYPLYNPTLYLPNSLTSETVNYLDVLARDIADGKVGSQNVVIQFPPLPTEDEFNKAALPGVSATGVPATFVNEILRRAREKLINGYRDAFKTLESKIDGSYAKLAGIEHNQTEDARKAPDAFGKEVYGRKIVLFRPSPSDPFDTSASRHFDAVSAVHSQMPVGVEIYQLFIPSELRRTNNSGSTALMAKNAKFRNDILDTLKRANSGIANGPQGVLARFLANFFAVEADRTYDFDPERARQLHDNAKLMLDCISAIPFLGVPRDLFEAYLGEDVLDGKQLSPSERALKTFFVASAGVARAVPKRFLNRVVDSVLKLGRRFSADERRSYESATVLLRNLADRWPSSVDKLRRAAMGIKNFDPRRVDRAGANSFFVAKVNRLEMDYLGRAWVGSEATVRYSADDGKLIYESIDGLRQYRPPEWKADLGKMQANLKERLKPDPGKKLGAWLSNAHFDVE